MKKERNLFKYVLYVVIFIVAVAVYFSCESKIEAETKEFEETVYIGYSNEADYNNEIQYTTLEEVEEYTFTKELYTSFYYYNQLNESEKKVYDLLRYAFENNYTYLFIDGSITSGCEYSLEDIAYFMSLDSPMLEQNLIVGYGKETLNITKDILYKTVRHTFNGSYVSVKNFTKERYEKKELALEEAKNISFDFSDATTEVEKARIIYKYLQDNIVYKADEGSDFNEEIMNSNYLYDALCQGATNCDGYANAFSLLCNLNGITCIEKMTEAKMFQVGHTWNTANLDGVWYNVDATEGIDEGDEADSDDEWYDSLMLNFAFSDATQSDAHTYEELLPACDSALIPVARSFETSSGNEVINEIVSAFRETDKDYILVTFRFMDKSVDSLLNDMVDALYSGVSTYTLEEDEFTLMIIKKI